MEERFVPTIERALREAGERRARLVAERELRLSEERYRAAFELAPEAIITYDIEDLRSMRTRTCSDCSVTRAINSAACGSAG